MDTTANDFRWSRRVLISRVWRTRTASAQASERTILARAQSATMLQALARGRSTRKLAATKQGQAELQERAAKHHKPSPPPSPASKSQTTSELISNFISGIMRLPTGPMKADGTSLDLEVSRETLGVSHVPTEPIEAASMLDMRGAGPLISAQVLSIAEDSDDADDDDDVVAVAMDAHVSAVSTTIEVQTPADSTPDKRGARGASLPGFLDELKSAVRERYGATVLAAAETVWKQALETADKAKLAHFLRRAEMSAQAPGLVACPEETAEAIFSFVLKLMLYAGADWYEVATGLPPPESVALTSPRRSGSNLGVAFDASSRLRRAGIEAYHTALAAGHAWSCAPGMVMLVAGQGEPQLMPIASLPPKAADRVRVVAI